MTSPGQPDLVALRQVVRAISPDLALVASRALVGGVSAQVTAVDAESPDGTLQRFVLRQYGPANLRSDPHAAAHESRLLALLHSAGLPVPRPRHADESCTILPVPYLVIEFIDGAAVLDPAEVTEPVTDFAGQLAAALAKLHTAGFGHADAPYLADIRGIAARMVAKQPTSPDDALQESAVRAALARSWPPPEVNEATVLHGDYWPGNTLWRAGQLIAVIDWEDAACGDPLADLGNARMEIWMAFGAAAASEFTRQYRGLIPDLDLAALPYWDLYAALRHAGRMAEWGLSPGDLARLQAGHRDFTAVALAQVPPPGGTRPVSQAG